MVASSVSGTTRILLKFLDCVVHCVMIVDILVFMGTFMDNSLFHWQSIEYALMMFDVLLKGVRDVGAWLGGYSRLE